jgi:hypothetical protein
LTFFLSLSLRSLLFFSSFRPRIVLQSNFHPHCVKSLFSFCNARLFLACQNLFSPLRLLFDGWTGPRSERRRRSREQRSHLLRAPSAAFCLILRALFFCLPSSTSQSLHFIYSLLQLIHCCVKLPFSPLHPVDVVIETQMTNFQRVNRTSSAATKP